MPGTTPHTATEYGELLDRLAWSKQKFDAAKSDNDRLAYALNALEATIAFLNCDVEGVATKGLAGPLAILRHAAFDAARGARPPLLQSQPQGPGSKPTGLARDAVRGHLVFALQVLRRAGMAR